MREVGPSPPDRDRAQIEDAFAHVDAARANLPGVPGYELLEQLHAGGQGIVYAAIQKSTRRKVAIKFLRDIAVGQHARYRFEREVRALAGLKHPNIVAIHDSGQHDGRFYLVMDFVEGVPLDQWLEGSGFGVQGSATRVQGSDSISAGKAETRKPKTEIDDTLRLFAKICDAVNAAHLRGVIHRDLKPANILIVEEADSPDSPRSESEIGNPGHDKTASRAGRKHLTPVDGVKGGSAIPYLLDFGLAKITTDSDAIGAAWSTPNTVTAAGQFVGSLPWSSPEQASGDADRIDVRTDVYALGVMMYHALAGEFPYPVVGNMADVLRHIQTTDAPPLRIRTRAVRAAGPRLPLPPGEGRGEGRTSDADLDTIVRKCLAKEPQRRYQSAGELAADLRRYLAGEPIEARRDSTWYVLRKQLRRYRWAVAVAAAFVMSTSALTLWALREARTSRALAESERRQAERNRKDAYRFAIVAADSAFQSGDIAAMQDALKDCPEDLRNWEWRYLDRLSDQSIATLKGHRREVNSVAFSPDGKLIASGSNDCTVIIWDASVSPHKLLRPIERHGGYISRVAFSASGHQLTSVDNDGKVYVWDASSGARIDGPVPMGRVESWGLSPDGSCVAIAGEDTTILRDTLTGHPVLTLPGRADWLAYSPGLRFIATVRGCNVSIFDTRTGECRATLNRPAGDVTATLAISPDGQLVAIAVQADIHLWSTSSGEAVRELCGHTADVRRLQFSPMGDSLVSTGNDLSLRVWGVESGRCLRVFYGHTQESLDVAFSPDSHRLATGGNDGCIKLWNIRGHDPEWAILYPDHTQYSVAADPGGAFIASLARAVAREQFALVVTDADGRSLWSQEPGNVRVLAVTCSASPQAGRIATSDQEGIITLWDATTGDALVRFKGHDGAAKALAFSPDSRRLASGGTDDRVGVWDAATWARLHDLAHDATEDEARDGNKTSGVWSVGFSGDGTLLVSASYDGTVRIWDAANGLERMRLSDYGSKVLAVTFSPDGKYVLAGGASDMAYTLKLWKVETGECVRTLTGHTKDVYAVAFTPDGSRFLSASADGTIKLWDSSGDIGGDHCLLTLRPTLQPDQPVPGPVFSAAFLADGMRIVTSHGDGALRIWDANGR